MLSFRNAANGTNSVSDDEYLLVIFHGDLA